MNPLLIVDARNGNNAMPLDADNSLVLVPPPAQRGELAMKQSFAGEDPLSYLPKGAIKEYRPRSVIYEPCVPVEPRVYMVMDGIVIIAALNPDQGPTYLRMRLSEQFIGEEVAANRPYQNTAFCYTKVRVMSWTVPEFYGRAAAEPGFANGLTHMKYRDQMEQDRIAAMTSRRKTPQRLAIYLLIFAAQFKLADMVREEDGGLYLPPLTHETIARFLKTSREIVTHFLNQMRAHGWIRYNRKGMFIANAQALREVWSGQRKLKEDEVGAGQQSVA